MDNKFKPSARTMRNGSPWFKSYDKENLELALKWTVAHSNRFKAFRIFVKTEDNELLYMIDTDGIGAESREWRELVSGSKEDKRGRFHLYSRLIRLSNDVGQFNNTTAYDLTIKQIVNIIATC